MKTLLAILLVALCVLLRNIQSDLDNLKQYVADHDQALLQVNTTLAGVCKMAARAVYNPD
jgi:hypothetical protein